METSVYKKRSRVEYLQDLENACLWLDIERGRAAEYTRLLKKFVTEKSIDDALLLSYFESYDLVEIFLLWGQRVDQFPGLKDKIWRIFKKGPILSDDENPNESTNRSRNDSFPVLLAGKFLAAGIPLHQVEGNSVKGYANNSSADFTFLWDGSPVNVECKRPASQRRLGELAKHAKSQIVKSRKKGLVALDCSVLARPKGTIFANSNETSVEIQCSNWLERHIEPHVRTVLSSRVIGLILYCRVPAMSPIGPNGNNTQFHRRDCSTSITCVAKSGDRRGIELMGTIKARLESSSRGIV